MEECLQYWCAAALGIIQGITEFLPVSSSAHLLLFPQLAESEYFVNSFDVTLHVATLSPVCVYKKELLSQVFGGLVSYIKSCAAQRRIKPLKEARDRFEILGAASVVCTVPAAVLGLLLEHAVENTFHALPFIAFFLAAFGALMYYADRCSRSCTEPSELGIKQLIFIGLFQAAALFPGVSRSGAVIAGSRLSGLSREDSGTVSLITAVPVIGGAFLLKMLKGFEMADAESLKFIFIGMCTAFFTGFVGIACLENIIKRCGTAPFAVYRIVLAAALLTLFFVK